MVKKTNLWLFLAGLGSATQVHVIGSIALTELVFIAIGPFLFFKNYYLLKRDGFLPFIWLTILTCIGCIISSKVNNTPTVFMLKGLAVPVIYLTACVSLHYLLRQNLNGFRWYFFGAFLSSIVCIFVFQPETYTGGEVSGEEATAAVMGYALFWSQKINAVLRLPIECLFLSTPSLYTYSVPIIGALVSVFFSSGSGRAAAAVSVLASILLVIGGKSRRRMMILGKNLGVLFVVLVIVALVIKSVYSFSASNGLLGEKAREKYESQTQEGSGILDILMAGRMELFCGVLACIDRPIIGFGPKAFDEKGYAERFLRKYGSIEDYEYYLGVIESYRREGFVAPLIPSHSYVVYFWLYYGIFGLLLWIYVAWLMYKYLRLYAPAIPQLYGYMCFSIPSIAWSIMFNPPGFRLNDTFFILMLLLAKAVYKKRLFISMEMEQEVRTHE